MKKTLRNRLFITGLLSLGALPLLLTRNANAQLSLEADPSALEAPATSATEETTATAANSALEVNILEILQQGGIMMLPLALLSLAALVLILLYFLTIRRNAVVSARFMKTAEAMIRKNDSLGAIAFCQRRNQSIARVTGKSLDFINKNPSATIGEVREVAQAEGSRQAGILTQRVTYLADIGSIAPMMGLLGTVIGMIKAFLEMSQGNIEGAQQMELASGVSEALVTTASGLVIGITALIFYSIFRARVQRYISELESASTHILALINSQFKRNTAAAARSIPQPRAAQQQAPQQQIHPEDLPPPGHL